MGQSRRQMGHQHLIVRRYRARYGFTRRERIVPDAAAQRLGVPDEFAVDDHAKRARLRQRAQAFGQRNDVAEAIAAGSKPTG